MVNPYSTLVAAYERLVRGRGREIVPSGDCGGGCSRHA